MRTEFACYPPPLSYAAPDYSNIKAVLAGTTVFKYFSFVLPHRNAYIDRLKIVTISGTREALYLMVAADINPTTSPGLQLLVATATPNVADYTWTVASAFENHQRVLRSGESGTIPRNRYYLACADAAAWTFTCQAFGHCYI